MKNSAIDFAVNDAGGGEHGDIVYGGNMVIGDTKGQDQLKAYLKGNIKFTDARVYISTVTGDFLAADIASDPEAGFQVIDHKPGQVNKNGTYPFDGTWCVNGLYAIFTVHRPDVKTTPIWLLSASVSPTTVGGTITDSTSKFVTDGFLEGMTLIIEGSTSNDGTYLIQTVAAGTITLAPVGTNSGQLTTEASPGAACILHGGSL